MTVYRQLSAPESVDNHKQPVLEHQMLETGNGLFVRKHPRVTHTCNPPGFFWRLFHWVEFDDKWKCAQCGTWWYSGGVSFPWQVESDQNDSRWLPGDEAAQ